MRCGMLEYFKRLLALGRFEDQEVLVPTQKPVARLGLTRPYVVWAGAHDMPERLLCCPNCGSMAPKPPLLTVRYTPPEEAQRFVRVLRCPDCTVGFYERQLQPDYADGELFRRGRVPFYLQQGAGIDLITSPLARVGKPSGSRFLDVGCGFGFGLDFATRELGWQADGIDPAHIAALGRDTLGVHIDLRYLSDDEPALAQVYDVAMASETLEHVPSPASFVRSMRSVLRPGAILIITTPDGANLSPRTAPGALVGLLAPGYHLIFQNRESLRALLLQTGFGNVIIEKDGHSLIAYASDRSLSLESDHRSMYISYLARRAQDFPPDHDLLIGFAGRAMQEAAIDGDTEIAERSYHMLREACLTRFGIDLDSITDVPASAASCSLDQLAQIMPLSLGCLLYADTMRRIGEGEARPQFERRLLCAAEATDVVRRAAAKLTMEDALSEEVGWVARAEAILCAVAAGSADIVSRVQQLPPFPGRENKRTRWIGEHVIVALVNAGKKDVARVVADETGLQQEPWANPRYDTDPTLFTDDQRDALFCLAITDMEGTDPNPCARAARRFALVRRHVAASGLLDTKGDLYWGAVQGEMQALERLGMSDQIKPLLTVASAEGGAPPEEIAAAAARSTTAPRTPDYLSALVDAGRYDEARLLAPALNFGAFADLPQGAIYATDRDRWFSLAVLDMQPGGDPSRAAKLFGALRASMSKSLIGTDSVPELYWTALRGEIAARSLIEGGAAGETLRQQVLQALVIDHREIPEDLRGPGQRR
jgi:2-polyprenyl-3-methyl-5-hydroxy-6-metoxy-1,4-benzoquinol methylase